MTEFWKSRNKYLCTYCNIYIADDAPSRQQHESGLKHIGSRDRYVRDIYKSGERAKKELEEEKREMQKVEAFANAAFARDVSLGRASLPSSSATSQRASASSTSLKRPEKPTSVWANYSTAQSLGYVDPDEERIKAEEERRRTQGLIGEWEVVVPPPPPLPEDDPNTELGETKPTISGDLITRKREAEAPLEDDDDGRKYKLRKKMLTAGFDELWDPGEIKLKPRLDQDGSSDTLDNKDKVLFDTPATPSGNSEANQTSRIENMEKSKWQPMGWKRVAVSEPKVPTELKEDSEPTRVDPVIKEETDTPQSSHSTHLSKQSDSSQTQRDSISVKVEIKEEDKTAPELSGSLFRKRKFPARGGRR